MRALRCWKGLAEGAWHVHISAGKSEMSDAKQARLARFRRD
jgi:hypothetical protein